MATPLRRRPAVSLPDFAGSIGDRIINDYNTYEDYLDSQITATDLFYLEDLDLARQLVELGYRSNAEIMTRNQFKTLKEDAEQARLEALKKLPKKLFSAGKNVEEYPFLKALAEREHAVRNGSLATIIFIRDFNSRGHEVSGYIDYGDRLRSEDLEPVFECKKRMLPRPTDLSYYNWLTLNSFSNSSMNFQVNTDCDVGDNSLRRVVLSFSFLECVTNL